MTPALASPSKAPPKLNWQKIVVKYQIPDLRKSLWQVANSFLPFFGLWVLMYLSLRVSYWLTLALAVVTAGFMTRIFIILHDCGHGSFFKSQKASDFLGSVCGVLTFTPRFQWRHNHAQHHATAGDLDRRVGWDLPLTLTVKEYLQLPRWKQWAYRLYRHPLVLFGLIPIALFIVGQRLVSPKSGRRERFSVHLTNLAVLAIGLTLIWAIGLQNYLLIQLPVLVTSATLGVWLFYVQHQFEDTYWAHTEEWDYSLAALKGSSYYKLPKVLQWFTGNIGLHHIHHLSSRIPNYALQKCHDDNPQFQQVNTITLVSSLKSLSLRLWDEERQKLISFGHLKSLPAE